MPHCPARRWPPDCRPTQPPPYSLVLQAAADVLLSRVEEAKKVPTVLMGEIRCARDMAP